MPLDTQQEAFMHHTQDAHSLSIQTGQRILLKISGEFLQGSKTHGLCWDTLDQMCRSLSELKQFQWVIVIGGGNFFRGQEGAAYCGQGTADTMGMLSTHLNGLALAAGLSRFGVPSCIMTARAIEGVGEPFSVIKAKDALNDGSVVICTGGLGHGAMTTDTAAVVRACELDCDWIIKGTSVKGVYDADPKTHPDALFYPRISYAQAIAKNLKVVDMTALTLAQCYAKPMIIFSLQDAAGLLGLITGNIQHSLIDIDTPPSQHHNPMG